MIYKSQICADKGIENLERCIENCSRARPYSHAPNHARRQRNQVYGHPHPACICCQLRPPAAAAGRARRRQGNHLLPPDDESPRTRTFLTKKNNSRPIAAARLGRRRVVSSSAQRDMRVHRRRHCL